MSQCKSVLIALVVGLIFALAVSSKTRAATYNSCLYGIGPYSNQSCSRTGVGGTTTEPSAIDNQPLTAEAPAAAAPVLPSANNNELTVTNRRQFIIGWLSLLLALLLLCLLVSARHRRENRGGLRLA